MCHFHQLAINNPTTEDNTLSLPYSQHRDTPTAISYSSRFSVKLELQIIASKEEREREREKETQCPITSMAPMNGRSTDARCSTFGIHLCRSTMKDEQATAAGKDVSRINVWGLQRGGHQPCYRRGPCCVWCHIGLRPGDLLSHPRAIINRANNNRSCYCSLHGLRANERGVVARGLWCCDTDLWPA